MIQWQNSLWLNERISDDLANTNNRNFALQKRITESVKLEMLKTQYDETRFEEAVENDAFPEGKNFDEIVKIYLESQESLRERFPDAPAWLHDLEDMLTPPFGEHNNEETFGDASDKYSMLPEMFMKPFRTWFKRRFEKEALSKFSLTELRESFTDEFLAAISKLDENRMFELAARTLTLELNVCVKLGKFTSDDASEQYREFCERFNDPSSYWQLFSEYTVLARRLVEHLTNSLDARIELFLAAKRDLNEVRHTFGFASNDRFTGIKLGAGDTHNRGRTVVVLTTAKGKKIVWKPHSLAVDNKFAELASDIAKFGTDYFYVPLSLDKTSYGWQEFVERKDCPDKIAASRFYRRFGAWLFIAYILGTTDMHFENLIANGDMPVVVDLETLFQPRIGGGRPGFDYYSEYEYRHSVLASGLLPNLLTPEDLVGDSIDISGLSAVEGMRTPFAVPIVKNIGRSDMYYTEERVEMHAGENVPEINGIKLDYRHHVDDISAGFAEIYHLFLRPDVRVEFDSSYFSNLFGDLIIRVVTRATAVYAQFLSTITHPDYGRDGLDSERLLSFFRLDLLEGATPQMAVSEINQLRRNDVPFFEMSTSDTSIKDREGNVAVHIAESPLDTCLNKISKLSYRDLGKQLSYIDLSFAAADGMENAFDEIWTAKSTSIAQLPRKIPDTTNRQNEHISLHNEARQLAINLGDRLLDMSFDGDGQGWMGLDIFSEKYWRIRPVGFDAYNGRSGIGLFFASLAEVTGKPRFRDAYLKIEESCFSDTGHSSSLDGSSTLSGQTRLGMYSELGGKIVMLSNWARFTGSKLTQVRLETVLEEITNLPIALQHVDIVSGLAGIVLALRESLRLNDVICPRVDDFVARCITEGLKSAEEQSIGGWGWKSIEAARPLLGFSHGASGIAAGIACARDIIGASSDADIVITKALEYEDAIYNSTGGWPDFRTDPDGQFDDVGTWCHGAVGCGIARLVIGKMTSFSHNAVKDAEKIAGVAADNMPSLAQHGNLSLCHGALGNLELYYGLEAVNSSTFGPIVNQCQRLIIRRAAEGDLPCGVPGGVPVPGLMTGMAGIGMGLLRIDPSLRSVAPNVLAGGVW